jgi:hypothetical protein
VGLSLRFGGNEVFPFFGSFLAGLMLILLCRGIIRYQSVLWLVCFFSLATTVTLGSYALAGVLPDGLAERARSLAALAASLVSGYGMFLGIRALGRKKAAKVFLYLWLFIVVFAFLEVYGGLRPLSDAVRAGLRPDRWLYELDLRDLNRYGAVRPKVFSAEPSIAGYTASLCLAGWFILGLRDRAWYRLLLFVPMVGITWYFVRSPAMMAGIGAALIAFPFHVYGRRHAPSFRWAKGIFHPILATFILISVIGVAILSTEFSDRFARDYGFFSTGSFFIRQVSPWLTEIEVAKNHLMLGVGVGGDDLLYPLVEKAYLDRGAFIRFPELFDMPVDVLITNAFFSYWHALGILGGFACAACLYCFCTSIRALAPFVLAATAIGGHAIGGMNSPRFWSLFFLYAAVSSMVAPRFATILLQSAPTYLPTPPRAENEPEVRALTALAAQ